MGVRMRVSVCVSVHRPLGHSGNDFDSTVLHSARCNQSIGKGAQISGASLHYDHFEAVVVAQMNVQGRSNLIAELMLDVG